MLRNALLSLTCVVALTGAAQAADMATKAPRLAAPLAYNWTGFYAGVHGGYAWNDVDGALAGGQIGYNWQVPNSPLVFGIEGDLAWTNADESVTDAGITINAEANYLASVRGRVGYAFNRTLVYATGGYAWANADVDVSGLVVGSTDFDADVWALGAGVEWAFAGPWSLKLEYVHYDLDADATVAGANVNADLSVDTVKIGLNYRFNTF